MSLPRLYVLALCLTVPALHAQVTATLRGRIADPSGAAIPAATVTLTSEAAQTTQTTQTTSAGLYLFPNLNPGRYTVDITAPSFSRLHRVGLTVSIGETTTADLALTVGSDQQSITVSADAPLLQSAVADIQTNLSGPQVLALPLNSRNFIQLATLAPGVELPPGTLLPRINGGRPRTNEYLYDGISALQPEPGQVAFFPIVDSIAEFTIEADNVPAEFGRFNGGVVNLATRAGSDRFHGSLFEFFRNENLNALNYFTPAGTRKPEYRRNLYGATLGGPVLHRKLFFFADYQGIKQLVGRTVISTIPTLAERQGIFTGVSKIYNPAATTVVGGKYIRPEFPNDTITTGFDPVAKALLARFPTPTTGGAANNYTRTANDADHQNQFDVRVDGAFRTFAGKEDRAFARYTYYSEVEQPVTYLPEGSGPAPTAVFGTTGAAGLAHILGQQAVFDETHTFTPRLLNDLRVGYTRRSNLQAGPTVAPSTLGIPGIPTNAAFSNALPLFTITGFQQLGPAASTFSQYQTAVWQLVDTVEYTRGRHQLKFGADIRWYQLNAVSPPNPTGSFAFTTTGTDTQSTAAATTTGGNALASFLLGQVDTFSIDLQTSILRPRDHIQEYFAQDDFRVSDRLTLNLGARWSLHSPSTEKNNQGAVFNLATQQLDYAGAQTSQGGNPKSARTLHYGNVAPRLGFTYLVTPRTVLRSGFGLVFIDQSGITTPFTLPQFPFIQNVQQKTQDSINAAFPLQNGPTVAPIALTPAAGLGQSVYTANRTAGSGYVEQWNAAIQHSLTNNLSFDIAYVGSHIVHVGIPDTNLNQLTQSQLAAGLTNPTSLTAQVPNPYYGQIPTSSTIGTKTVAAAQLLKPYPRFQNVAIYRNNTGTTNYNAIEAKVEQRLSHGVTLLAAYTHSKLIDDASSVFSSTVLSSPNSSSLIAADAFTPRLERDSSNGDMPNVTSIAVTYALPNPFRSWGSRSPGSAGSGERSSGSGSPTSGIPGLQSPGAPSLRDSAQGGGVISHLGGYLLNGWTANAIASALSGMPVTVTQATNTNSFAGFSLQRPNLVANPTLAPDDRTPQRFFNTQAFATAPQFTLGNASRNPVRGPAYRDLDVALVKHIPLTERADAELRAEHFNLTNTPAFAQPNGSFGAAAFGSITSTTTDPRILQIALRLSF